MRDKAKGLCITSERYVGELGVQCLSTLNVGQDSMQQSYIGSPANLYRFVFPPLLFAPFYQRWTDDASSFSSLDFFPLFRARSLYYIEGERSGGVA